MKICRFTIGDEVPKTGVLIEDRIFVVEDEARSDELFQRSQVILLPPVIPSKIVCVGRNYAEHARELGNEVPTEPLLFLKAPSSVIGDGADIVMPPQSVQVEHEGELAIVIGRACKNLSDDDDPLEYIFGYSCLNDVTARDLQRKDVQFTRAKSFDTFCPIGPFIETELDPADIRVVTRVNGVIKQDGRTSQMIFPVPFLVRYISRQMTLHPGDVIATGTPSGVSKMVEGDLCEVEIEGIGVLTNKVTNA
jgi:2-keto-4-pentenoate hydratase/2-oxohepta-3-ene-1,7-dioic acid hydratase in catechol pathway